MTQPSAPTGLLTGRVLNWYDESERIKLGRGTFSTVYLYPGQRVVKLISHGDDLTANLLNEVILLRAVNHPNVLPLEDVFVDNTYFGLVLPYREKTLTNLISEGIDDKLDNYIAQLAAGITAVQNSNILHGDYKPDNILYDQARDLLQIADFGIGELDECYGKREFQVTFTRFYRAPEIVLANDFLLPEHLQEAPNIYTTKSDSWALGCIIYEMITGNVLMKNPNWDGSIDMAGFHVDLTEKPTDSGLTRKMKEWYAERISMEQQYIRENSEEDEELPEVTPLDQYLYDTIPTEYAHYIPLLQQLLQFFPDDRIEVRSLLQPSIPRDIDCSTYLIRDQYPLVKAGLSARHRTTIVTFIDYVLDLQKVKHRRLRIVSLALTLYDLYADSNRQFMKPEYLHYALACIAIAGAFYHVYLSVDELVEYNELEVTAHDIFVAGIEILNLLQFDLVRATAFDILTALYITYEEPIQKEAIDLLKLSQFTLVSRNYLPVEIAENVLLLAQLLHGKPIKRTERFDLFAQQLAEITNEIRIDEEYLPNAKRLTARINAAIAP